LLTQPFFIIHNFSSSPTPSSYDYKNKGISNEEIILTIKENNISVMAITDHHIIDVERVWDLYQLGLKYNITALAGIEFLSDTKGKEPIHFIGIFDIQSKDKMNFIWDQLKNKTNIAKVYGEFKKENEIYCDLEKTIKIIKELGGIVTIHAGMKHGSIECITNALPHTMAQKEDIAYIVDIFELGKENDVQGYIEKVFHSIGYKPMILCSDNHDIKNYKLKSNCWIKANPTFEGLKQIIYEPEERVFIGDEPELLQRVRENKTKFIKSVRINQINGYNEEKGVWFKDIEIPLNPGLVSIIGNRGNGKSALTDIIALCGNSHQYNDFSFLNKDRFLKDGLAGNFEAELIWENGESIKKNLSEKTDHNAPERVRYLPQNFFERLTNNLETYEFERTLEDVVFSYIPEENRFGKSNFKELIKYKRDIADKEINNIVREIKEINEKIIEKEEKNHPDYKKQIEEKLKLKKKELEEHEKIKPKEVSDPSKDNKFFGDLKNKQNELSRLNKDLTDINKKIDEAQSQGEKLYFNIEGLKRIRQELNLLRSQVESYKNNNEQNFKNYGLKIEDILKFEVNFTIIDEKIKEQKENLNELKEKLLSKNEIENQNDLTNDEKEILLNESLKVKQENLNKQINTLKTQLSEPQKKYHQYLEELKEWEEKKKDIEGDENKSETIKWFERELNYINNQLNEDIENLRKERLNLSIKIYNKKKEIVDIYSNFKKAIEGRIQQFQQYLKDYNVSIDASLTIKPVFYDEFLSFIDQSKKSSFYGLNEGKSMLEKIVKSVDINTEDGIRSLLSDLINYLENDMREDIKDNDKKRYIKDQISKKKKLSDFYDYIFSLSYLEPEYELKLSNKTLNQLSPGERGALLIVFYLMLDKEDIPLIIDQPEENLDNESVYKIISQFIKDVKKERQLIVVTHNPNLAIVGDAEQIVFCKY